MTYKTIVNGVLIEADTVKEILALAAAAPSYGVSRQRTSEDDPALSAVSGAVAKTKKTVPLLTTTGIPARLKSV